MIKKLSNTFHFWDTLVCAYAFRIDIHVFCVFWIKYCMKIQHQRKKHSKWHQMVLVTQAKRESQRCTVTYVTSPRFVKLFPPKINFEISTFWKCHIVGYTLGHLQLNFEEILMASFLKIWIFPTFFHLAVLKDLHLLSEI